MKQEADSNFHNPFSDLFRKHADYYDDYHISHTSFTELLKKIININTNMNILDVGCGTGNETANIYRTFGCKVHGVDPSEKMLKKATNKCKEISWVKAQSEFIPMRNNSINIITFFFSFHHINNIYMTMNEVDRVINSDGVVFIVTISHEQMKQSLEYEFFPELFEYDIQRVPAIEVIESLFVQNGFKVTVNTLHYETRKIDADYIKRIKNRYRTGLNSLSDNEILQGLQRIKNALKRSKHLEDSLKCSVLICKKVRYMEEEYNIP